MWLHVYIDTHMNTRVYMRMTTQSFGAYGTHGIHLSTPTHMHTYVCMCVIMHAVMLTGAPKSARGMDVWATWVLCGVAACTILRLWGIDCSLRWCTSFPWNDSIRLVLSMHILAAQSDVRAYVHTCNQYRHAHFRRIQTTYYEQEKTFLNDMFMCTSLYITGSQTSPTLYVLD